MASKDTAHVETDQPEVTVDEALRLAQGHHKSGNLIIADRTYRDILRSIPDHHPTIFYLGVLCYQRGSYDEALELLQKSVEVDSDDSSAWTNLGIVFAVKERYEEALESYDKALEINKENHDALSNKSYTYWLMEDYEQAEKLARASLEIFPGNPGSLMNLGIALAKLGRYDETVAVWNDMAEIIPESSQLNCNWSTTLRKLGRLEEAEEKARKSIELDDQNHEAWNNMGLLLREYGQFEEAEDAYRKATDLKPDYALAHQNLAIVLYDAEKYKDAIISARYALSYNDKLSLSYIAMALANKELGERVMARDFAEKATIVDPDNAEALITLANILVEMDRLDEGEACLQRALEINPDSARFYSLLSDVRLNLTNHSGALEAIDKAIELAPKMPLLWRDKSQILHMSDQIDEGLECIEKAIELAPKVMVFKLVKIDMLLTMNRKDEARELLEPLKAEENKDVSFYHVLGSFKKYEDAEDQDLALMQDLHDKKIDDYNPLQASSLCFALSKAYEDLGDYDLSFQYLKDGNDRKKATLYFDNEVQDNVYEKTRQAYSPTLLNEYTQHGCQSELPVFIVGMPRSGTTLTEQIISSHPDVFGAGELSLLGRINRELGPMRPDNIETMGQAYVDYLSELDKTGKASRITDKMPGNFMSVGFIHCVLPNARIIHCRRNPVDTCLSNYKQNFAVGQYWSYDLDDLALQYQRYQILMDYWEEVLPGRVLNIDYEQTVTEFEDQARKLIDFVGLPWNDACLEPHKQKRTVLTASKDQVIKPVYQSSVEKWRRFEKQLQPLVEKLLPEEAQ